MKNKYKIKGWIAQNEEGEIHFFNGKPKKYVPNFCSGYWEPGCGDCFLLKPGTEMAEDWQKSLHRAVMTVEVEES